MGEPSSFVGLEAIKNGKGVRVEFQKTDDLFSHTTFLINQEQKQSVLISLQSHDDQFLPCFTELHEQGEILFLTGANGPCHWSMSVQRGEIRFQNPANFLIKSFQISGEQIIPFLHFDMACRLKESDTNVGSQYLLADQFRYNTGMIDNICSVMNPLNIRLGLMQISGVALINGMVFSPEPDCFIKQPAERKIQLSPKNPIPESLPATMRWSYGVSVV